MSDASSGITIRPMIEADLDQVLTIGNMLPSAPLWPREVYLRALDAAPSPRRLAIVAIGDNGAVLGFAVASLVPPEADLETVAVAPAFQRAGIARHLLQALAAGLQTAAVSTLQLEVRPSNLAAVALYLALGFAQSGRRPNYYADPVEDALLMELALR